MLTPYDWQEGIAHRAGFAESRLATGNPVLAVSLPAGILIATFRYQTNKVFEIYDRIAFSGIGQQSDLEAIRVAAIEFCHQEGYQRSEDDVTVQRLAAKLSEPVKQAFADFRVAPVVARCVFAEVNDSIETDRYMTLDYDGEFHQARRVVFVAGSSRSEDAMVDAVGKFDFAAVSLEEAEAKMAEVVLEGADPAGERRANETMPPIVFESVLMMRDGSRARRFDRRAPGEASP